MMKRLLRSVQHLQVYCQKWWYQPLVAFLAAIDHYILFIPVDGLLASSVLLNPRKWFSLAIYMTIGSTTGVLGFVWILHLVGIEQLMAMFPALFESQFWNMAQDFFQTYGAWILLFSGASPLPQQPAVITTALAEVPFWTIASMLVTGRLIKFMFIAYISSHAPQKLSHLWGLQGELKEMDVPEEKIHESPTNNAK